MSTIKIEVDTVVDAAYITLSDVPIARTVQHNDLVLIDLDEFGVAVGIEVLEQSAPLPFQELVEQYHVRSQVVELLRLIRPDISSFVEITTGTDGNSSAVSPSWDRSDA